MTSSNIGRDKSFVDDLNKERGIVSPRVAFVPRSTEIQPSFCRFVPNHLLLILSCEGLKNTSKFRPSQQRGTENSTQPGVARMRKNAKQKTENICVSR